VLSGRDVEDLEHLYLDALVRIVNSFCCQCCDSSAVFSGVGLAGMIAFVRDGLMTMQRSVFLFLELAFCLHSVWCAASVPDAAGA
jgi:hypothetical protein